MNPIPTPLTEQKIKHICNLYPNEGVSCEDFAELADFARTLERENHLLQEVMNKATEFADGFPAHLSHCTCEYCALAKAIKDYHSTMKLIEQPEIKGEGK